MSAEHPEDPVELVRALRAAVTGAHTDGYAAELLGRLEEAIGQLRSDRDALRARLERPVGAAAKGASIFPGGPMSSPPAGGSNRTDSASNPS